MIILQIIFFVVLIYFGSKDVFKKKQLREGIAFFSFFLLGAALMIAQTLGVKMPYLIDEINKLFKNVLHLSFD
jgi:hypothetical protein